MKKILLVLTLTTLIFACKKDDDQPNTTTTIAPVASFSFIKANNMAPSLVTFTNSSLNATSYSWDFGDGTSSTELHPTHLYTEGGEYDISLTASNSNNENIIMRSINVSSAPTTLQLSSIKINAMPMTNNGNDWDWDITGLTSDPDVFYVLKQGGADVASSSSQDNISTFPISFTENLPYTINNLSQEYTIELYDNDQIAGVGENELIGSCSFTPNEHIPTGGNEYPTEINITSSVVNMTLDVEWLQ